MGVLRLIHRQRGIVTVICACCLIVLMPLMAQAGRDRVLLDAGWKFALEGTLRSGCDPSVPSYDDSHWRRVDVPHDYVIEQPFTQGLDPQHASLPTPAAWYRKTIIIPASARDQDVWLDFDGLFRDAKIYRKSVREPSPCRLVITHISLLPIVECGSMDFVAARP